MKFLILTLALSIATAAPAFASEPLPFPRAEPIRMASVKIHVRRGFLTYQDTLERNSESVCEIRGEIPVYAPADATKIARLYNDFHCDIEQDGKKVRVQVSSGIWYDEAKGEAPAKKSLRAMMFVTYLETLEVYVHQPAYVATADLGTKSLELYLSSGTYEIPEIKSGTPSYEVVVEATDSNQ